MGASLSVWLAAWNAFFKDLPITLFSHFLHEAKNQ